MATHSVEGSKTNGTQNQSEVGASPPILKDSLAGQIAAQGMSRHSVDAVIAAADAVGLSYDEVAGMPDADVYARLFPGRGQHESVYAQPDWSEVHRELARARGDLETIA